MSSAPTSRHSLGRNEWDDFVALCYFGREGDWLDRCIRRAYLDMNRTLHGMSTFGGDHPEWKTTIVQVVRSRLMILARKPDWTMASFDAWHRETVEEMQRLSEDHGFHLSVGQCQKWINMTIKYIVALGERRVPGFSGVYDVAHVALDSIVLARLEGLHMPPLGYAWSKLDDYSLYMTCQTWVREHCQGIPLETEYRLWQEGTRNARENQHQADANDA
jgi:hypothetical protein